MFKHYYSLLIIVLFFSCRENNEQSISRNTIKVVEVKGYVVPKDSMGEPTVIPVDESKLTKIPAGKPEIVPTNLNIHPAGLPKIVVVGIPRICSPGNDNLSLPKVIPAVGKTKPAGVPEIVVAKDAVSKDANPSNFSFYKTLQGLKHHVIRCMLEDRSGNLWFCINGGGVCRYDGKFFTNFTVKEGLPSDIIWSILEDKAGRIWLGTGYGVCCYDGKSFTVFTEKEGLPNNTVMSLWEDKEGNIWFGTYGGVCCYDGKNFTNFSVNEGLSNNYVNSILEDKSGNMWFATIGGGVNRYDGKSFTHFTEKEGLPDDNVNVIYEDKIGNIWLGTQKGGVCRYDGNRVETIESGKNVPLKNQRDLKKENGKLIKSLMIYSEENGLQNNFVNSILEDREGNLLFGSRGGVCFYDGKSFIDFSEKEGLPSNDVFSILEDKTGTIWLSTNGGACRYDGKSFTNFSDKEGLSTNIVNSVLEDKIGNMWFCTYGGGVSKYDGKSFSNFTTKEGLLHNIVWCSLEDRTGKLWFGTYGGVSCYDGKSFLNFTVKNGLPNQVVWSILEDKKGNIWFGTNGGVCRYDGNRVEAIERGENIPLNQQQDIIRVNGKLVKSFIIITEKEGLSNNFINAIFEDKSSNLWFCTYGGGVSKYDGKIFTHFTEKEGFPSNYVSSILQDMNGNFWLGTYGAGICCYDEKNLVNYSEKDGLCNNFVVNISQDSAGNLWFGTRKGLSKVTIENLKLLVPDLNKIKKLNPIREALFYNYGYNDGFLGLSCRRNSVLHDRNGKIWWGADVLTRYSPNGDITDTTAPIVRLNGIKLYNENVAWRNLDALKYDSTAREIVIGKTKDTILENGILLKDIYFDGITKWYNLPEHLSLPYNNNNLTFSFIGIHMQSRNHIKYQYKLEGIDPGWSSITEKIEAPYGNLPSGEYTFKVKAMNQSGVWSEPFEFKFEVRPPWWKTWWFRTLVGLIIIGSVWYYIKWRERTLKARQNELEEKIEEATEEIKEKQKEIIDSIRYAQRIQRAHMPTENYITKVIKNLKKD